MNGQLTLNTLNARRICRLTLINRISALTKLFSAKKTAEIISIVLKAQKITSNLLIPFGSWVSHV
jgi:hypothetical protein